MSNLQTNKTTKDILEKQELNNITTFLAKADAWNKGGNIAHQFSHDNDVDSEIEGIDYPSSDEDDVIIFEFYI